MFTSGTVFEEIGDLHQLSDDVIKNEPMLDAASRAFVLKYGGPVVKNFLKALPEDWIDTPIIVDTRVQYLKPGMYPKVPGWHLTDVPRTSKYGQPEVLEPRYKSEHVICVTGATSFPEFLVQEVNIELPPYSINIYDSFDEQLNSLDDKRVQIAMDGRIYRYDWNTVCRSVPANASGWRLYLHASRYTERDIINNTKKQVQVYLPIK
jgi:hypothetical protein